MCLFALNVYADDTEINPNDSKTTEEILSEYQNAKPTNCASEIFSQALVDKSNEIHEMDEEDKVRAWAQLTMQSAEVLEQVLQCPEIKSIKEDTTIIFNPIVYTFPNGREITINYSTQPKVLKHHLMLARKRSLLNGDNSPKLGDPNDPAKYINTDPAWYGILVVQHGALDNFVGEEANNTVSIKYINDNIDSIYPQGYYCTSRSAWANDKDTINQVVKETVDIENDSNDYYVAGDINLEWVMYAEIAADIILTVVTAGGSQAVSGTLKGARATRSAKNLMKSIKTLNKLDDVKDYVNVARKISTHTDDIAKLEKNLKNAEKYQKTLKKIDKGTDVAKNRKELEEIMKAAKEIDPKITEDLLRDTEKIKGRQKELREAVKPLEKQAEEMVKASDNVKLYKDSAESLSDVMKYRRDLRAFRRPQTGNVFSRSLKKIGAFRKSLKAANSGAKMLRKADKLARAGMSSKSAKLLDWLFQSSLKHGARLARFERDVGLLYGAVAFLGDMYDKTSTTSQEFSNGIEFKPFCLLSADDIEGQDNVVNYGMWLMWQGNSTDPADDDAAYLQSMDFAGKFFYNLDSFQEEHGVNCNVDIYVVRPIIRLDESDMTNPSGEMFYLIMNEIPWSTNKQFKEKVGNIEDWERTQQSLAESDPENKSRKHDQETTAQESEPEQPTTESAPEQQSESTTEQQPESESTQTE